VGEEPVTGLGYTVPAVAVVLAVVAVELLGLRTGLFRRPAYWISMLIVFGFQIPVDGWLTKLSAPVVRYSPAQITGLRGPWDIPVEDFLFGFALVTAALLLWERQKHGPDERLGERPRTQENESAERTEAR
jgi:lycopene cyclase domain-containing protein